MIQILKKQKANVCAKRVTEKVVAGIALTVLIAASLTGCGKKEAEKTVVRVGFFPNLTHAQALVMKDQAKLEEALGEGYEVQWQSFNAGPAEVEALMAGEIDLGYIGPVPALNANAKSHGEVQIISNATNAGAVLICREDVDISEVADLDGKKVAIPQLGNTQHLCLLDLLKNNGLSPVLNGGTVDVVAVANADVQGLMEKGEIDAALVPEPWGSILEEKCNAKLVLDYDEIMLEGEYPTAVVVAHKDFMERNPEALEKFLQVHEQITQEICDNPVASLEIVSKGINEITGKVYEEGILESAFSRMKLDTEISKPAVDVFAQVGLEQGFIAKEPDETLYR